MRRRPPDGSRRNRDDVTTILQPRVTLDAVKMGRPHDMPAQPGLIDRYPAHARSKQVLRAACRGQEEAGNKECRTQDATVGAICVHGVSLSHNVDSPDAGTNRIKHRIAEDPDRTLNGPLFRTGSSGRSIFPKYDPGQ